MWIPIKPKQRTHQVLDSFERHRHLRRSSLSSSLCVRTKPLLTHSFVSLTTTKNNNSETVKTRMQVSGGTVGSTVTGIASNEGIAAFWKGIVFAYGRELTYTSVKLGAYAPVRDMLGAGSDSPFYLKFLAGAITGGTGSIIGNPFDVMKTLSQTNKDASKPLTELVGTMYRDQGIGGFYRGVQVNIARACVLNATKMGCYDMAKGYICEATGWKRKDVRTAFCSAFVAGFFMTCRSRSRTLTLYCGYASTTISHPFVALTLQVPWHHGTCCVPSS